MPDIDDMPDPIEETYLRAEQALDDEAARAARRAKVLAAVAQDQAIPTKAAPASRGPVRRYGGWLAAACVAGISVFTAQQAWRSAPDRQPSAPPPTAKAPGPEAQPPTVAAPPAPAAGTTAPSPPTARQTAPGPVSAKPIAPRAQSDEEPAPPPPPPPPPPPALPPPAAAIAPPPPLPIPPVEKPIQAPVARAFSATLAPPPPPAAQAKAGVPAPNAQSETQTVVVTGSRIARHDANAPPGSPLVQPPPTPAPLISGRLQALDGPSKLREAATAGQTADILTLLDQGVPVDATDEAGETALMKAVEADQLDAVVLLRRHGASLDLKNRAGVSARQMAARKNDLSLNAALDLGP